MMIPAGANAGAFKQVEDSQQLLRYADPCSVFLSWKVGLDVVSDCVNVVAFSHWSVQALKRAPLSPVGMAEQGSRTWRLPGVDAPHLGRCIVRVRAMRKQAQ